MDHKALADLIKISNSVGSRPDYVQGGGGNTSVKSADGKTMAIKASGTTLASMNESAGWVELDLGRLLAIFDVAELANLTPDKREARVLAHQHSAVVGGPSARPSVESALHGLLGKVVIHTHPVAANALTCGPGKAVIAKLTRKGELPPLWVPYTDPGYKLAVGIKSAIDKYQKQHGRVPAVMFLQNHGIFVSAGSAKECVRLHNDWIARCEKYFNKTAPALVPAEAADPADVRKAMAWIRRAVRDKNKGPVFARLSNEPELTNAAMDPAVGGLLARGALSPDHIVYTGAHSVLARNLLAIEPALAAALDEHAPPRVVLVKGLGAFLVSNEPGKLGVIEETAAGAAKTIRLAAGSGGARNLKKSSADFIINWEVEHYRAKLLEKAPAPLSGKIAAVTGAASGLGLGIALGLAEAGAAVAFCDIDEPGLDAAIGSVPDPARALAVKMDVTDEEAVAAGFDRVIAHWGGVDIVVCAAGIAPPYELVDMPVGKWRLALEINLTGYFLVAREGARVMKSQGVGGSMVMVSSKSGLEASKANSAYNATKAGELHLMRGLALELGPDGIRVNAVAPGNVFEGSKIWNPEYIKACAKKKGIKPEEVIPHYVSLTALNREIKRSDVADAVCFLCSDKARCITGQTLVVDSGQVMAR